MRRTRTASPKTSHTARFHAARTATSPEYLEPLVKTYPHLVQSTLAAQDQPTFLARYTSGSSRAVSSGTSTATPSAGAAQELSCEPVGAPATLSHVNNNKKPCDPVRSWISLLLCGTPLARGRFEYSRWTASRSMGCVRHMSLAFFQCFWLCNSLGGLTVRRTVRPRPLLQACRLARCPSWSIAPNAHCIPTDGWRTSHYS